jgi:hypothetical protein
LELAASLQRSQASASHPAAAISRTDASEITHAEGSNGWKVDIHIGFLRELIGCSCIAASRSVKHGVSHVLPPSHPFIKDTRERRDIVLTAANYELKGCIRRNRTGWADDRGSFQQDTGVGLTPSIGQKDAHAEIEFGAVAVPVPKPSPLSQLGIALVGLAFAGIWRRRHQDRI